MERTKRSSSGRRLICVCMQSDQEFPGVNQEWPGGAIDFRGNGSVIRVRGLVPSRTILEPVFDIADQSSLERRPQDVVVGHRVHVVAEDRFEHPSDQLERQLMAVLEPLDHTVAKQLV